MGIGLAAGIVGGLLGIGGGTVIVPGLVFFLGFHQHKAHGTSLGAVLVVSAVSAATYWYYGHVEWRLSGVMAMGGVAGAWMGANAAGAIKGSALRRVFSVFLALVGVRMILGGCLGHENGANAVAHLGALAGTVHGIGKVLVTGLASGFVSGLLGIGGGIVSVPAMVLLLGLDQHTAQGISLAAIVPTVATGTLMHQTMGNVEFRVAKWVGLGAIAGGFAGASLAGFLNPGSLKLIFGSFLAIMAVLMALKK